MAFDRFRQLGDLNDSFVASFSSQRGGVMSGAVSSLYQGGGEDEELLFNMSEIDIEH
jgi:hypothetical protein